MRKLIAILLSLAALPAFAHPGEHHQGMLATLWHLVSQPDHLALIGIAVIAGAGSAFVMRRRAQQKGKDRDPR